MSGEDAKGSADELMSWILGPEYAVPQASLAASEFRQNLRRALHDRHARSAAEPINYPSAHGVFSMNLLASVPPVVLDANRLRDDILYSCDRRTRTVLVNAANAGLIRLFAAQHVVSEVAKHSAEWTAGTSVSQRDFLARWLTGYLPLVRVLADDAVPPELLTPDEAARLAELSRRVRGKNDVPSAKLSMVLGAFYLTNDRPALRAVYGADADLSAHDEWQDILRAGGDAGELGGMLQVSSGLTFALAQAGFNGARSLVRLGPLDAFGLVALFAAAALGYRKMKPETKAKIGSAAAAVVNGLAEVYGEYEKQKRRFKQAGPVIPSWRELASLIPPDAVLTRACMHTLARVNLSPCSAKELRLRLPLLPVASGEAKVRQALRSTPACFAEVYVGRWQVGDIAEPLRLGLSHRPELAGEGTDGVFTAQSDTERGAQ